KDEKIVNNNIEALNGGFKYIQERLKAIEGDFELEKVSERESLYLIGNDAIGFGALNAGVRFMAAYPITPASDIMEYMIEHLPKVDGTVIQTEDEISEIGRASCRGRVETYVLAVS